MKAQIVSFHCVLRDKLGTLLSSTYNQDVLTDLETDKGILRGLTEALQDLKTGQSKRISLSAEEAYGYYRPELQLEVSRHDLPQYSRLQLGDVVKLPSEGDRLYRVVQATQSKLTLDANHPFAGQDLVFDIKATEVREATPEELSESRAELTGQRVLH